MIGLDVGSLMPFIERVLDIGWTYFIQPVDGGLVKIGFTRNDPRSRLADLQIGSPVELQIVGVLRGWRERELHRRFKHLRVRGEWFRPTDELVDFLEQEKSMEARNGR